MKKKVIFFDAGETLVYRNPSLLEISYRFLKREGYKISKNILSDILNNCAIKMKPLVESAKIADSKKWAIYIEMVFKKLKIKNKIVMNNLREHLKQGMSFRPFPGIKKLLSGLKRKGFKLGVISNASNSLYDILKRTGLSSFFDVIIVSEEVGCEKPDVRIFKKALNFLKIKPYEAVFIGDNFIADIIGAKKAGITPVWLQRKSKNNEFSYSGNAGKEVYKIRKVTDIIKLIKSEEWN